VRGVATAALGKIGQIDDTTKDRAYDRLVELLRDEWLRVRLNAIAALVELKEMRAVSELERTIARELDGRVIRAAREAIVRLRQGADKGEEIKKLRSDLDRVLEENRGLRDRLDKLEARVGTSKGARTDGAKPAAAASASKTRRAARPSASRNGATPSRRTPARRTSARRRR
jgi:HEAT repeat protein